MRETILSSIDNFIGVRVLVYGDFVLDEFLFGEIDRISREAPVFIVSHETSDFRPGCAANTVANLAALGSAVIPCGTIGEDDYGIILRKLLNEKGISTVNLISVDETKTALKTRVIAGVPHSIKQQIVRIDRLRQANGNGEIDKLVKERMNTLLGQCDAVLISDYGIDGLKLEIAQWLVEKARKRSLPVLVDSRYRLDSYPGATASTPNQPEAEACAGMTIRNHDDLYTVGEILLKKLKHQAVVITRGGEGMTIFRQSEKPVDIPAYGAEEVVDVTGAGDTVIAAFALAMASGLDVVTSAKLANVAGGLSVLKKGTCTVSTEELKASLARTPLENG